jgi:hypothetical protein
LIELFIYFLVVFVVVVAAGRNGGLLYSGPRIDNRV